jgi:hypothetical protein
VALRPRLWPGVRFRGDSSRPRLRYGVAGKASITATASTALGRSISFRMVRRSTRRQSLKRLYLGRLLSEQSLGDASDRGIPSKYSGDSAGGAPRRALRIEPAKSIDTARVSSHRAASAILRSASSRSAIASRTRSCAVCRFGSRRPRWPSRYASATSKRIRAIARDIAWPAGVASQGPRTRCCIPPPKVF